MNQKNTNEMVGSLSFQSILTNSIAQIMLFAVLMTLAAQIAIPAKPIPFTLQTLVVVLSGAFLGAKKGAMSQIVYLAIGLTGLPVFALVPELGLGITRLFGPTGGYLLAFPLGAFVVGALTEKYKKYYQVVLAMILGELVVIALGAFYLDLFFIKDFQQTLKIGVAIFSFWLVLKVFAASSLYFAVKKFSEEPKY